MFYPKRPHTATYNLQAKSDALLALEAHAACILLYNIDI